MIFYRGVNCHLKHLIGRHSRRCRFAVHPFCDGRMARLIVRAARPVRRPLILSADGLLGRTVKNIIMLRQPETGLVLSDMTYKLNAKL